jgi:hypothetical protein
VYVYLGGSGALWQRKTGTEAGEQFGRAVAAAGDIDDDGDDDYVVGAPLNDRRGTDAGQVSVYSGRSGVRLHVLRGGVAGDRFGWSVAGVGDLDGDGSGDIVVGAINDDTAGTNAGAAIVYSGLDGSVLFELLGGAAGDRAGDAVTGLRDLDGDGVGEVAFAGPRHDAAGGNAGRVWVHAGSDGSLLLTIDGENAGDEYGTSLDGDPRPGPTVGIIAGAWPYDSFGLDDRGSAYRHEIE